MHFQDSLPKLPIPKLADSMRQFLYFAEPLVSPEELSAARDAAAAFESGVGPHLQQQLIAADSERYSSFISKPWFDLYLKDRASLLLGYNPQLTLRDEPPARGASQPARAARLVHSALTFLRTIEAGVLEPDVFHTNPRRSKHPLWPEVMRLLPRKVAFYGAAVTGAYPLDMSQYANLFRSTRVPHAERDELVTARGSRHIVVQRGGRFFSIDVMDAEGNTYTLPQLQGAMQAVIEAADAPKAGGEGGEGVGVLTTLPRDEWAALRGSLAEDERNARTLQAIDSAIFAVCLDASSPEEMGDINRCMLHGKGTDRWLDKSFQLIVTANAKAAINFEHAWGDGVAVLRFATEVVERSDSLPAVTAAGSAPLEELVWHLRPPGEAAVADAAKRFDATIASTDLSFFRTDCLSARFLKQHKLSPDGMMQMAFQLAHVRMHGHSVSTYESASTAAFKHGRTETIRSATPESAAFAAAFCDPSSSPSDREAAMRAAVKNHSRITRDALTGKGVDRHLFALRALALSEGGPLPTLFESNAYATLAKIIISTSTLQSDALSGGGFGPVNSDCYAVGYSMRDDECGAMVMSHHRDAAGFVGCIEEAMRDMRAAIKQ